MKEEYFADHSECKIMVFVVTQIWDFLAIEEVNYARHTPVMSGNYTPAHSNNLYAGNKQLMSMMIKMKS